MGETLFQTARGVYAETRKAEALLDANRGKPQGTLRVTTSLSFGNTWLVPRLTRFVERYPDIDIELLIDDADLDISMREADVAIRFESSERPELVRKPLATIRFHAWAAPAYLQAFEIPQRAEDLDRHRLIAYQRETLADDRAYNWPLWVDRGNGGARKPTLRTDTLFGAFQAVANGFGIAVLPEYYAWDHPELVQVLPGLNIYEREVSFLYAPESRALKRLEVFREFVAEEFPTLTKRAQGGHRDPTKFDG